MPHLWGELMSIVKVVNAETGEEIEREMTAAELKEAEKLAQKWQQEEADKLLKEQNKLSAENKLSALGLTEAEIAALRG